MFLRFVVTIIDEDSHKPKGLFIAAHELLDSGDCSQDETHRLRDVLIWFNQNLPSPKIKTGKAIFWFKAEAEECIDRIWELVHLLEFHGYLVEMQKCRALGNVIYEDKFQVAAYPSKLDRRY